MSDFETMLASGTSRICRAWELRRRDGVRLGFTDHDGDLEFDGLVFQAGAGLTPMAVQHSTGLAVNNSETLGLLSADQIREEDIAAGRYDGAALLAYRVCWEDVALRRLDFRGTIGAITRQGAAFRAELRGLTEALNTPQGHSYHRLSPFFDPPLGAAEAGAEAQVRQVIGRTGLALAGLRGGAFANGVLEVLSGPSAGLRAAIHGDAGGGDPRRIELLLPLGGALRVGDRVRLIPPPAQGLRGFPHIPGEDWLMAVPRRDQANSGGSRYSNADPPPAPASAPISGGGGGNG